MLGPGDLPLSLGGTGADLALPSAVGTLAWIGLHDGQLFVLSGYGMFGQMPGNMLLVYGIPPRP